ncbi:MAG TPA: hypothetical protein VFR24_09890 [Candidatus Angelobacter sp.]|nr:hypothetical protein [Candidatus Angelobacter sp.]
MKTKVIRMLVLGLLLGASTIYADGPEIPPYCPGGCPGVTVR